MSPRKKSLVGASLIIGLALVAVLAGADYSRGTTLQEFKKWARLYFTVLRRISRDYYIPVSQKDLLLGSIKSLPDSLDRWSSVFRSPAGHPGGETLGPFVWGQGLSVAADSTGLRVQAAVPGSPARRWGLSPGDRIIGVNSLGGRDLSLPDVESLFLRPGVRELVLSVVYPGCPETARVVLGTNREWFRSVPFYGIVRPRIGYIRVGGFRRGAADELFRVVSNLGSRNLRGLILDLRGAAGGYLDEVVKAAGYFLRKGDMVCIAEGRGKRKVYRASGSTGIVDCPLVVLVDEESIGPAEVLAAACRDNDRAVVVGGRTPGLAFVQKSFPVPGLPGLYFRLTKARLYSPAGKPLAPVDRYGGDAGVNPDYPVADQPQSLMVRRLRVKGLIAGFADEWVKRSSGDARTSLVRDLKSFLTRNGCSWPDSALSRNLPLIESCLLAAIAAGENVHALPVVLSKEKAVGKACEIIGILDSCHSGTRRRFKR